MPPIGKYFAGHGDEVMQSMMKTYGNQKKAESVFYALENIRKKRKKKKGMDGESKYV